MSTMTESTTVHLRRSDPTVDQIVRTAFPGFTGQDVRAEISSTVRFYGTMWDEGSKRDYVVVRLADLEMRSIPTESFGTRSQIHEIDFPIAPGTVIVCRDMWGKRSHIEIIGPPENITPMLPAPSDLTDDERTVLIATRSLKSSYGGVKNYRFVEAQRARGITQERWDAAKSSLTSKGLLNKAGAITVEGRNAIGTEQL